VYSTELPLINAFAVSDQVSYPSSISVISSLVEQYNSLALFGLTSFPTELVSPPDSICFHSHE